MTTPSMLKAEFSKLFEAQKAVENDPVFQLKKRTYQDVSLETQYDQTTLSEIFQDPDLLARISEETFSFIKLKERKSRVKSHLEYVTTKKPQAKDVPTHRVISDYEKERLKALEGDIDKQSKFISPLASKKRIYLAQSGSDPVPEVHELYEVHETIRLENITTNTQAAADDQASQAQTPVADTEDSQSCQAQTNETDVASSSLPSQAHTPITDNANTPTDSINSTLALPALCIPENAPTTSKEPQAEKDDHPLEAAFRETALLYHQSPLKTVGPHNLYTLLPRQSDINAYKYVKQDYTPQKKTTNADNDHADESRALGDILLTITVFNPTNPNKKLQQLEILGSQSLSDFRDSFHCFRDFSWNGDGGEVINMSDKKLSPAMIYMDHVFYIDTRSQNHPANCYTDLIDGWLTKKGVNKAVFRYEIKDMQTTLFQDIPINLHQPCVFLHRENCEHMIIVQDVRLLSPMEYKSKKEFPRTTHNLKYDRFKCSLCTVFPATKMTEEEIHSGFSPCYWCDICFESFHNADTPVNAKGYSGTIGGGLKFI